MSPPANSEPITAYIDTQDEPFVQPIREFLEAYGCDVFINKKHEKRVEYNLVVGDILFVMEFFAKNRERYKKTFIVLFEGSETDAKKIAGDFSAKVALVDPVQLSSRTIGDLFEFFFAGSRKILNLQTRNPRAQVEDIQETDRTRIQSFLGSVFEKGEQPVEQKQKKTLSVRHKRLIIFFVLILLTFVPVVWYLANIALATGSLVFAVRGLKSGNLESAKTAISVSSKAIGWGKATLSLLGGQSFVRGQERLLSFLEESTSAIDGSVVVLEQGKEVGEKLLTVTGIGSPTPAVAIDQIRINLSRLKNSVSLAKAELAQLIADGSFPFFLPEVAQIGTQAQEKLAIFDKTFGYADHFLSLYPEFSGFKQKKTYLVLFQNSMELRPTGGFIGSFAIATFAEGKLADFSIQDVYTVDGQLKGHVDPPGPIREILKQEHWYLRDSNWDPDFAASGPRAAWFYEKETGTRVDGVIAINLPFFIGLLRVIGPLDLPDYNDRITADNFFGKSLYYTKENFFPGSTQKKDFLGSASTALVAKVTAGKGVSSSHLLAAVVESLERGDILFSFADHELDALIAQIGWAGIVPMSDACTSKPGCLTNTTGVFEANLSVNKVNYFVKRVEEHNVVVDEDGSISGSVTVLYQNTSPSDSPSTGGGAYRTYVQVYLPPDATATSLAIDGQLVLQRNPKRQPTPVLPYFEESDTSGAHVVGVALDIFPTEQKRLTVAYERQAKIDITGKESELILGIHRQPGLLNTTLQSSVTYPIFWTASDQTGLGKLSFLAKQGRVEYNMPLVKNQRFTIRFSK